MAETCVIKLKRVRKRMHSETYEYVSECKTQSKLATSMAPLKTCLFCDNRKWQDYVYIQCEYKSTKQKIKHLLREENKVKENKIS